MKLFIEVIAFLGLFSPFIWERWDDRKGDFNKTRDVFIRIAIAAGASIFCWLITAHSLFSAALMCFAIFFLLFDYAMAAKLGHKDWFSYLGESGPVDNIKFWRNMHPGWRFAIRMGVMAIAIVIYF